MPIKAVSRATMRSSSRSMGEAESSATSGKAKSIRTRSAFITVSSIRELEDDVHHSRGVDVEAAALRRTKPDFARRGNSVLIQPVTQSSYHAQDANVARGSEQHFEQHLTFDPEPPCFIGVRRMRLGSDFGSRERCRWGIRARMRSGGGNTGIAEIC